jgi:BirA family biotin operon repressor/biotin-[acetyl-CoA-carboxylase] ligase
MDVVDGGWVRQALPEFFTPLEVAARVPTTMARAAELAGAGEPEGATVVAEEQTEGRGRLGRAWVAPPGSSLLLSVVLRPPLAREAVWLTVAAAGVALAEAVDAVAPQAAPAGLKWPNDLELGGRKAAGLLAEAHLEGDRLAAVLLGMGVNVGQAAGDFPPEVAARATSVALAAGAPVDRGELLAAWAGRFLDGYAELCADRPGPVLAAYRRRLRTVGRRVRADRIGADPVVGTAVDLTPSGALVVQTASGSRVEVLAGDVQHLRPG